MTANATQAKEAASGLGQHPTSLHSKAQTCGAPAGTLKEMPPFLQKQEQQPWAFPGGGGRDRKANTTTTRQRSQPCCRGLGFFSKPQHRKASQFISSSLCCHCLKALWQKKTGQARSRRACQGPWRWWLIWFMKYNLPGHVFFLSTGTKTLPSIAPEREAAW